VPDWAAFNDLINEKVIKLPVYSRITIVEAGDVEILLMLTDRYDPRFIRLHWIISAKVKGKTRLKNT
jgi:hypothetical protein